MNPGRPATPEGSGTPEANADEPVSPGYFPRLLSAAAHVTHAASEGALERFGLNRDSLALLSRLEASAASDSTLAAGTGQSLRAVRRDLASLQSSGYTAEPAPAAKDPDRENPAAHAWTITEAGRRVIKCAQLAEAEITLDAEDSVELRKALRSLIASLGLERPGD